MIVCGKKIKIYVQEQTSKVNLYSRSHFLYDLFKEIGYNNKTKKKTEDS